MARTVQLIDPIDSISNLKNGTPNYEDLFIFAELLGNRRSRSVIDLTTSDNKTTLSTQFSDININMLGVNFKEGIKNSANLTTNWTDNESNLTTPLEGFGINKIDIKIDSSYIPKVNIEFVDVRGASFYNIGENSPYALLFDFPPPIFKMTIKGYYGKSLDYDLHLVKHNTRFDSDTGNYYTNVEFIARTFAPLADIPFKYVEIVSLLVSNTAQSTDNKIQESANQNINNNTDADQINSSNTIPPKNTFELLKKIKRFVDELKNLKKTSEEAETFENAKSKVNDGNEIIRFMNFFKDEIRSEFKNGSKIIIQQIANSENRTRSETDNFRIVNSISVYDDTIKKSSTSGNNNSSENTRLQLGILYRKIRNGNQVNFTASTDTNIRNEITEDLISYKNKLEKKGINFSNRNIKKGTIPDPVLIKDYNPENIRNKSQNNYDEYLVLDVTDFYIKINKSIKLRIDEVDQAQKDLVSLINERVENTIGFKPTIYNIFKILCDDIDVFFREIGKVSVDAENHHEKYFDDIIDIVEEKKSKKDSKKLYPFPLFTTEVVAEGSSCNVKRKVRKIPPVDLVPNEIFPEVRFIQEFIDALILSKKREDISELRTKVDSNGNNIWIPVNPADSKLSQDTGYDSPYANLDNGNDTDNIISTLYDRILNRFYVASQFSYAISFYSSEEKGNFLNWGGESELKRNDLIKFIAESEAVNLANSVINEIVLEKLKNNANVYKNNPENFYNDIAELNVPSYSSIPNNVLRLRDNQKAFYKGRSNPEYVGFEIVDTTVNLRINGNSSDPVEKYIEDESTFFDKLLTLLSLNEEVTKTFTTDNILFFSDSDSENNNKYQTKFLYAVSINNKFSFDFGVIDFTFGDGEVFLYQKNRYGDYAIALSAILAESFSGFTSFIRDNNISIEVKAFVLASFFGRARSYFTEDGKVNLNFLNPAAVEVPKFSIYYMGGLILYNNDVGFKNEIDDLFDNNNFLNKYGNQGGFIRDGANRVQNLSEIDSNEFLDQFNLWIDDGGYNDLLNDYFSKN